MALIKCNECGKEISDKALKCPHCGTKNELLEDYEVSSDNKNTKAKNIVGLIFILIGLITIPIFLYFQQSVLIIVALFIMFIGIAMLD